MSQRFENRGNRGFSLVETLAVVAILVILLSVAAVAAAYYRDYLKITELDNAAREIYMAAENRAVLLDGNGQLEGLLSASALAEGGTADSPWLTKDDAAAKELLTAGAIDPALLEGDFRIIYDPDSFAVTDVFYAEAAITKTKDEALGIAGDRDARMRETPMLGYYGGEQEARKNYTPLPAPEVMVEVENGDLLKVHVTFSVPDSALSVVGNNWIHEAKQTVELTYSGKTVTLLSLPGASTVARQPSARSISASAITYTWILDALDAVNSKGESVGGRHFWQLFDDPDMSYGEDFTVTAEIELSAPGRRSASASGSDMGNSLFAEHSGGGSARLENLRHLQNLDAVSSKVKGKTSAVQLNDIDCRHSEAEDASYGHLYAFKPVVNEELLSFDGGWTAENGGNRRNEITDLGVTEASAQGRPGAGLFAETENGMTFTGVRLTNASVNAGAAAAAGVLVGSAGSGSSFRDIRVVNSKAVCPEGPAGGIAGRIAGAPGEENTSRFTDCRVYWEPEEGQDHLRSLLGSDQTGNPYKYGEIIHGTSAGGLAGELSGTGVTEIKKSLASTLVDGAIAGGLIGSAQHKVIADTSYADCYMKGETHAAGLIGRGKTGGTGAGVELTNVYSAGFIDCGGMGAGAHAAGLACIDGTVKGACVYDAMSFLNQPGEVIPDRGVADNGPENTKNCYYLDPLAATLGEKPAKNGPVSYDDMSTAGLFDEAMGGAFAFKTVPADTNPYNLQEKQTLNPPYSFPGLIGLPHYGDWRAYFKEPSLVYYERDSSGKIGFSGGNARELIGQLEEGVTVEKDGYAVALMKKDLPASGSFTVTYTYLGEDGEKKTKEVLYSKDGMTGERLLEAVWERTEGGQTVKDAYWLAPLPDELVIGETTGSGEFRSPTTKDFYQYLRFTTDIQLNNGSTGSSVFASGEYFYNPHFAETVKPYVPEEEGKPFIDWEGSWTGGENPPCNAADAAEGIHRYITETLTPGNRPVSVSVRTPRHLFHLSQYEDYYNNARLAFQQGLRLDGGEGVYTGYDGLLKHEEEARKFQLQSPIGTQAKPFLGTYNGNFLPIRRVAFEIPMNDQNRVCAGLFGSTGGTLQNIVYSLIPSEEDAPGQKDTHRSIVFYSSEKETFLGALAGFNTLTGKILNCAVEGVNLTTQVNTSSIYIGGLCGENAGLIRGSAAESAYLHVEATNYAQAYAGGLTGYNRGEVDTSYAVGRLAAEAAQENAPVTLAGFAGRNSGSISNSYSAMDLRPDGTAAGTYGFCGPSSGGRQSGTYYLDNGNFSYRDEAFLAKYEEGGSAKPLTYVELTAADAPVPGMGKVSGQDAFPYPTGVKKGAAFWHYGDWPKALELGTMGVYYWEELQVPGKPISYHVSLLAVDPGKTAADPKTVTKLSTLSTAHDQGGEVVRCGYGIYNKQGITVTLKDDTPFPLLYSVDGGEGGLFHELYGSLEAAKKDAQSSSGTQAYLDRQVDEALARLMSYELDKDGKTQVEFHSFHSFGLQGNALGGLYPDADATRPNGTLTLFASSGQDVAVTFALNPFFADALAVELPGANWTPAKDVPTFTRPNGGQKDQTKWSGAPGGSEARPYGVRSIDQLQLIDWNNKNRDASTVISDKESTDGRIRTADTFPYLSSKSQKNQYYWTQTYDLLGERDGAGSYKTYTPIAEYYDTTGGSTGTLTGWFGGIYNGGSYKIENVNIQGQKSSCAGLFGVIYDGRLKDVVLYSSDGNGKISTSANTTKPETRWFAIGALAGVAGTSNPTANAFQNCSVAGYDIEATGYTYSVKQSDGSWDGWGGNYIGGMVGASHMNLSGCSAVVNVKVHDAQENDNMRVGGLVGTCQGAITNCYAGGSISIDEKTVTLIRADDRAGIFIGGLVGGSYMKPLTIDGTNHKIGTEGNGANSQFNETNNELTNCYSFMTLPALDDHPNLHGLYAIGGTGEIYAVNTPGARRASNHGICTITNCYYLADEVMANNPGKDEKSSERMIIDGLEQKRTNAPAGTDWAVGARKTDVMVFTEEQARADGFKDPEETEYTESGISPRDSVQIGTKWYHYRRADGRNVGTPMYDGVSNGQGGWNYVFIGWLVKGTGSSWEITGNRDDEGLFKSGSGNMKRNPNVTGLTYEQLKGDQAGIPDKDSGAKIYDLLGPAGFEKVTTEEDGVSVPGKYSYPTQAHPELRDRDYPFPTVLLKDNGKYHVHYGDWPLKGFRRQTLFDEKGGFQLLGGSPIEIDLFVNGDAPHQEYLVLTDGITAGGGWSCDWESTGNNTSPLAEAALGAKLTDDEIPNAGEKGKHYYRFTMTPKQDGTDILNIHYRDPDGGTYDLAVTVHITAAAELRPNRLFMFPNDTLEIDVRAADKAGQALELGGELTLKGDPHCGSSGYLTAETLRNQATEAAAPAIRFKTAVPEGAAELETGLGANADFAYTVTTPDPAEPDNPDKAAVQDYGGGAGGDIRVEIIRPWKGDENFVRFKEVKLDGDKTQVTCIISFPDHYDVGEEGTLFFERSGALVVAPMPLYQPKAEWIEEVGKITLKLTYPEGAALAAGIPETTVSIPLKLTSGEADGQLIEGEQLHTLTLTVESPAETRADAQGPQSIDALPPGEDGQDNAARRRRWKGSTSGGARWCASHKQEEDAP